MGKRKLCPYNKSGFQNTYTASRTRGQPFVRLSGGFKSSGFSRL